MERKVTFSPLNQYRFIPLDEILPDKYNNRPFDRALYTEIQEHFSTKSVYAQKVQKTDACRIQIKTSQNTFPPRLYIYKCGGELEAGPFDLTHFPIGLIEDGIEQYIQIYKDVHFWVDYEGLFYLVIECRFDEDNDGVVDYTDWFVSEPILVKERHPKTLLLEYSNSTNKDGIIFQQTKQKFGLRVEGAVLNLQPKVNRVTFVDQGENSVQLSATAYRSWMHIYGFSRGIPAWMIDKLNHIHACDSVYSEGVGVTPLEGSVLKYEQQDDTYGLSQVSIELGEKNNTAGFEYTKGGIPMFDNALTFPYLLRSTSIGYPGNVDYFNPVPVRIGNLSELEAWITARNLEIEEEGLTGSIGISTTTVVYNLGLGEHYSYAECTLFRRRLGIKNTTTGVFNIPLELEMRGNLSLAAWAVTGPLHNVLDYGNAPDQNAVIPNYIFNYVSPGAGTYTFELWHEGTIFRLYMFGNSISGIDKFLTDESLPELGYFGINGSTKLTSFSLFDELAALRPYLIAYRLQNNPNLTDSGVYYPTLAWSNMGWKKLKTIILQNNKLNTAMIDQWFNSMRAAMLVPDGLGFQFYVSNGNVYVDGQVPAAGVTLASAVARAALINQWNWVLSI